MKPYYDINQMKRRNYFTMSSFHYHEYYEIYYLMSGQRYYYIEDSRYLVKSGSMLFINKYDIHRTVDSEMPHHERIVIYFNDAFLDKHDRAGKQLLLSPFHAANKQVEFNPQEQSMIEQLLFQMMREKKEEQLLGRELYFESLIVQLLLLAARKAADSPPKESQTMHAKMSEIIYYCNENFHLPLHLEHISKQFYISPFYFSRLFKQTTGFTFTEYINTLRIREAQRLLRESSLKMIEISEKVGYASVSHFNRKFKQITHMSPKEYKKMSMNKKTPSTSTT